MVITDSNIKRLCECVFDITLLIGSKLDYEDSRELFNTVFNMANEFEENYKDDDDYMSEIEKFVNNRLDG